MARKKKNTSTSLRKKYLKAFLGVMAGALLLTGYSFYREVFAPNVNTQEKKSIYIYIKSGSSFQDLMRMLQSKGILKNSESFEWVAEQMKYKEHIKPGKYLVRADMNNRQLIGLLRSGKQIPVRLSFSNIRTIEQFSGIVGSLIEADSASVSFLFHDESFQSKYGFNGTNSFSILLPNTFELKWNTSAEEFYQKLFIAYTKFWNVERMHKSATIGLSKTQVAILASIVEQETRKNDEKILIAGVYINRFRKGMKLEADPTLVYALGNFSVHRVLNEYKSIRSPYNTYMFAGLPPGPICMPSENSIDAVLNYKKHDYLFFCAREDFSGYHTFAKTYDQHLANARRFQHELNRRGIKS